MTALHVIADLDDGRPVSVEDLAALEVAERHASDHWHRRNQIQDLWAQGGCVICGVPLGTADGDECDDCAIAHDASMRRREDQ